MRLQWDFCGGFVLAIAVYAVTVPGTYIYDDVQVVQHDPRVKDLHLWGQFWREGYYEDGLDNIWRPVVSMSIAVQEWLTPGRAWPLHLVNVLLHAVASGMAGLLGTRIAGRRVGVTAGLLFAVHPVHVEAVAGIVGRAEAMVTIGILGALLAFIDRPLTVRQAVGITGWFLLAALCKEQGILVPVMVLAAWGIFRRSGAVLTGAGAPAEGVVLAYAHGRTEGSPEQRRAGTWLAVFLMGTLAGYISYRNSILPWYWERGFLDQAINPLVKSVGADRWWIPVAILGRYVALMVWPARLFIDYSAGVFTAKVHWGEPYVYIGAAALAAGGGLLVVAWVRRWRAVGFCLICFGLVYLMVSNVVLIGTVFGERLAYVPSAFFCLLVAIALGKLERKALVGVMGVVLALASVRTVTYAWRWNEPMRLFLYAYETEPRAANINRLLAGEYVERGELGKADEVLANARRVAPEAWLVWYDSAKLALKLGRAEEAMEDARTAMRIHPSGVTAGLFSEAADAVQARSATRPAR